MKKISVIIPTARSEEESLHAEWTEIIDKMERDKELEIDVPRSFRNNFSSFNDYVHAEQNSFLDVTLESLGDQTFNDFEVLVIDFHRDRRPHLLDDYRNVLDIRHIRDKDSIWHDLESPSNFPERNLEMKYPAPSNARNTGIIEARGELLVFLDDNIILSPKALEACWKEHRRGRGMKIWQNKFRLDLGKKRIHPSLGKERFKDDDNPLHQNILTNALSLSLDSCLELNGLNEDFDGVYGAEDVELAIRLNNLGHEVVYSEDAIASELGHKHIQHRRYNVRQNRLLLHLMIERWGNDLGGRVEANKDRSYLDQMMKKYAEMHEKLRGRENEIEYVSHTLEWPLSPYFDKNCEEETFDLREKRK